MKMQALTPITGLLNRSNRNPIAPLVFLAALWVTAAQAGVTDIASRPLATSGTVPIKPNLLFILDDSGSMFMDYMPDLMANAIEQN